MLEQISQSGRGASLESIQGQAGQAFEKPGLDEDVPDFGGRLD